MPDLAPDHYELLGVSPKATQDDIKRAFREKIRDAHPDRGGDTETAALLTQAYDTLSDPSHRDEFDRQREPDPQPAPGSDDGRLPHGHPDRVPDTTESATPDRPRPTVVVEVQAASAARKVAVGVLSVAAIAGVVAAWSLISVWLMQDASYLSSDVGEFGHNTAQGIVFISGSLLGMVALFSPARAAAWAVPFAIGLLASLYGQLARAVELPGRWIGELFSDQTWPYWGWAIVAIILASTARAALLNGIVRPIKTGFAEAVGGNSPKSRTSRHAVGEFMDRHTQAGHRCYFTQAPFTRSQAGVPTTVQAIDLFTGQQESAEFVSMAGHDDTQQWVIAVDRRGFEVERISAAQYAAWSGKQR